MSLYPDPLITILSAISIQNPGVTLDTLLYTYGMPTPVAVDAAGTNTSLLISSNSISSTYAGVDTIRYTRLNLADLAVLVPLTIGCNNPQSTMDVANRLNVLYGTNFTATDIQNVGLTTLVNGAGAVVLNALAGSLGWIGSVTVNVVPGGIPLVGALTVTKLPGLNYPDPDPFKIQASPYSYWQNFSPDYATLQSVSLVPGEDLTSVLGLLTKYNTDAWVLSGQARFSLGNATVTYNGLTGGFPQANQQYQYVMILQLDPTQSQGIAGTLYFHYNLPNFTFG